MSLRLEKVCREIVDLHVFFVEWFTGRADKGDFERRFLSHLDHDVIFIPPEGQMMTGPDLAAALRGAHASNPDFKIQIRDVEIHRDFGNVVLATYTEWQIGARNSVHSNNARLTSVLLDVGDPIRWLHIQETALPEAVRAAGPYDF